MKKTTVPHSWAVRMKAVAKQAEMGYTATISQALSLSADADQALNNEKLGDHHWSLVKFHCSSLLINIGNDKHLSNAIAQGIECAESALGSTPFTELESELKYNIANGLLALSEIDQDRWHEDESDIALSLLKVKDRVRLRRIRSLFLSSGSRNVEQDLRSRALCNLGNVLDTSGRWLEAYQVYVDALEADPTNGNAAGNAAELLRRRASLGRGLVGHYAALYDHYRDKALRYRSRTVELAGEHVAKRWDSLPVSGTHGHVAHNGDPLNEYQQWIMQHRLVLTVAAEGLGSDDPRWDVAMAESVTVLAGEPDPPLIYTSMNILKAEYLVARRLAFDGEKRLRSSLITQDPLDSGTYADTLNYAIYGEPSAQLVLAQRSTLDLLDKIAVAANDHFKTKLKPGRVQFNDYWRIRDSDTIREPLPVPANLPSAAVALAELAFDIDANGLYPDAKTLRNAGTHRLVHVTHGQPTGVTLNAHSSVDSDTLIHAAHQSLKVARAAYIYLIDLIQDNEDLLDEDGLRLPISIPIQR